MRKALIVGLNEYNNINSLTGCVEDASKVYSSLTTNADGSPNFDAKLITNSVEVTVSRLKESIEELFNGTEEIEVGLFYFSGHGAYDNTDSFLVTSDAEKGNLGVSMNTINKIIKQSKIKNKIIILDCCFAGAFATMVNENGFSRTSEISDNTTIMAASKRNETSVEINGAGLFTSLFLDALSGGASDILGNITPASIYAYIDKALGAWDQRPIFLTHSSKFIPLKKVQPPIDIAVLRNIVNYFSSKEEEFELDPSYEYTHYSKIDENVKVFKELQKYERNGLVVPNGEEHMYYAAINSKSCKLTAMGYQYWKLIKDGRI